MMFISLNPMPIFNSHLTDLSTAYDIVLGLCCWFFLSSLISQHWMFQCVDFIPTHTFGALILAIALDAVTD